MGAATVLYIEETTDVGQKDAQLFVAYSGHGLFRVYFTRAAINSHSVVPVSRLAFKCLHGVILFLKTVLSTTSKLSLAFYTLNHFDDMMNFNDLWEATGPNNELCAYDEQKVTTKGLRRVLRVVTKIKTEETFAWSKPTCYDEGAEEWDEEEYEEEE
jgi:hypothetical protein